jgi:hypothetical protein
MKKLHLFFTVNLLLMTGLSTNLSAQECDVYAGQLIPNETPICLMSGQANLSATEITPPFFPPGSFEIVYILTIGVNQATIQFSDSPDFTVYEAGYYTIYPLVIDAPDIGMVLGSGSPHDIAALLVPNGGEICGAINMDGAVFIVEDCQNVECDAAAGTLTADGTPVCLEEGEAMLSATEGIAPVVPAGFEVVYVLTAGNGLVIIGANATPDFTVDAEGDYTIHTLVYDPADQIALLAATTGIEVNALLIQGGGELCGALDVAGAAFVVEECTPVSCETPPINVTHCYGDNADDQFLYMALNPGDLPTLVINSGSTESCCDVLTIYDGDDTSAPVLYTGGGNHAGATVASTSGFLLVRIVSDGSVSCATGSGCCAAGLDWDVFCGQPVIPGCTDPLSVNYDPAATEDDGSCVFPMCADAPINVTHCYGNDADDQFLYAALNPGDMPVIAVNSGTTESCCDTFTIYDGDDTSAPVLYTGGGNLTGVTVESTSGFLLVQIESDGSVSCASGSTCCAAGIDWDVYCGQPVVPGCTDPLSVNYDPTATEDDGSCVLPSCEDLPLNVTHCYDNNADDQFVYSALNAGDLPTIFINSGTTESGWDFLTIYDGDNTGAPVLYTGSGDHGGVLVESTSGFLLVRIVSDESVSCATEGFCCAAGLDWDVYCGQLLVEDCNGELGGTAYYDFCDECVGGSTGEEPCPLDCNGVDGGEAYVDECGTCVGGDTNLEPCEADCNGVFGGTAYEDECEICVGGNTNLEPCEADCNGVFGGTAYEDECEICVGGTTGLEPCVIIGVADGDINSHLSVYPNPNSGQFIVEMSGVDGIGMLNIMDMMGRMVYTGSVNLNGNFRQSIDLNVAGGTYILQVMTDNGIATRRVQLN